MTATARHVALLGAANSIHLQRWALALAERGLRVSVITQHGDQALDYPPPIALHRLPWRGFAGYFANVPALRALLRRLQPDLLHVHYASGYGSTAALARWRPMLLSVWGADVYEFPRRGPLQRALLLHNLRRADRLASTSEAMAAQVRRLWPTAGPIAITPFGVDTSRFVPAPKTAPALVVGTVKTLAPKYGIDTLLQGFALARGRLPADAQLQVVGDGPQRAELAALATRLGLDSQLRWIGAVDHRQVPARLQGMDVYVAVSRDDSESFGVAVVEASACALPVIVSDAGGLPEVVEHGVTGLVVPREDPQALADAIVALAADALRRARLGAGGRARVLQHYDWPRCVDRLLATYDAVLAPAAKP